MAKNKVITPGGHRDRSRVRLVQPGSVVDAGGSPSRTLALAARPKVASPPASPTAANWISAGWWYNNTGQPITSFVTTWTVPPAPAKQGSQLIYLFNGMEPADNAPYQTILQPVLQWGDSGEDDDGVNRTGPFWTVASWLVPDVNGLTHHTPHVRVEPGQVLVGVITGGVGSDGLGTYTCSFQNVPGTLFSITSLPELVWCVETLEAYENGSTATPPYDLDSQSEYPATVRTAFQAINILTGGAAQTGGWTFNNYVTKYGEHTTVVTNSASHGEVDIYYYSPEI